MRLVALLRAAALSTACLVAPAALADAIVDWNEIAGNTVSAAAVPTPPANRVLAIAHVAAANALDALPAAADERELDAAIAAAFRRVLDELVPAKAADVEREFGARVPAADERALAEALAIGEAAARKVLDEHASDAEAFVDDFRADATAGAYVPTASPVVPNWSRRKPWFLASADALRPPPPPALDSDAWTRAYDEVRTLGGRTSTARTAEQTAVAKFWEATLPPLYHQLVRGFALQPGRTVRANAHLFARVACAMDDTLIAVFDAKYHYRFWRPVTAIRNGDRDGNDATARDAAWLPLLDTPMHPEYPCAHCAVSAVVATVLADAARDSDYTRWSTTSPAVGGIARNWTDLEAFATEVANARVWSGVHYRFSAEAGTALGRAVGNAAIASDQTDAGGER